MCAPRKLLPNDDPRPSRKYSLSRDATSSAHHWVSSVFFFFYKPDGGWLRVHRPAPKKGVQDTVCMLGQSGAPRRCKKLRVDCRRSTPFCNITTGFGSPVAHADGSAIGPRRGGGGKKRRHRENFAENQRRFAAMADSSRRIMKPSMVVKRAQPATGRGRGPSRSARFARKYWICGATR